MTATIPETWPQFLARLNQCKAKGRLSPAHRLENIRQFHKPFPSWDERMEWLEVWTEKEKASKDDVKKMEQILLRKFLLDVRELYPQRHDKVEKRLRGMPRFAVSVMGALH